jgi:predicted cupin superfamily sugar epimerase
LNPRAAELIRHLSLQPHPEGGFYREIWRSAARVCMQQRPERSALTSIYFLLAAGSFSAWHRVRSDEVWHWYEGDPLALVIASPDFEIIQHKTVGPVGVHAEPVTTVPADWWQAARPLGDYTLCGCTVAPGFEFEDFSFLRDDAAASTALRKAAPELDALL